MKKRCRRVLTGVFVLFTIFSLQLFVIQDNEAKFRYVIDLKSFLNPSLTGSQKIAKNSKNVDAKKQPKSSKDAKVEKQHEDFRDFIGIVYVDG